MATKKPTYEELARKIELLNAQIHSMENEDYFALNEEYMATIEELRTTNLIAEQNEKKFRFLANNSIDCLWQLDRRLKFIYLSPSLYDIAGFKPEEWIGTNLWSHFKRLEFIRVGRLAVRMLKQYKTFGYVTFTTKMINKSNKEFPVEIISKPMIDEDGNLLGLQGSTREISERVRYQKELEKLNNELKEKNNELNIRLKQIKEINSQLIVSKIKAEESDRLKSAFLANMSHEIRTPMNGILGFTELLGEPNLTGAEQSKYIEIIKKSGQRMLNTVNDIIDISKIDSGQVEISMGTVDLQEEIENLYEFFKPEASKKGISFKLYTYFAPQTNSIQTDQVKLNSILSNLVKNAIKYTDSGSVEIYCGKKNSEFEFKITDTGIGIPADRIDSIFNRFEQADIADKYARQGSGLGLSIAKAYVEMLQGSINVKSESGKGSTFFFRMPWPETQEISEPANIGISATKESEYQIKLLIAEDDDSSFEYLSAILEKLVHKIERVENGYQAVEFVRNHPDINLVLMDIQMPGINGYEASRQIRTFNKDLVIIAQTAFALSGDKSKALEAGCNNYISKPVNKKDLLYMINTYFNK